VTGSDPDGTSGGGADRKTVARIVTVLDALAESGAAGVGVRELAQKIGMSSSAVHRVLAQFADLGVAQPGARDRYEAGSLPLAWAALLAERHTLEWVARDALAALAARFDESAYLVRYDPAAPGIVFVAAEHSTKPIRYVVELASRAPLHAGAAGKAVMAHVEGAVVEGLVEGGLERYTSATLTDPALLRIDLAAVRQRGYALSVGERIEEAVGVAAPVFRKGLVAGALTVTLPRYRFDPSLADEWGRAVAAAAAGVTRLLSPGARMPFPA
jgi:DNA-binding IclR family transcriptional regulator